MTSPGGRHPTIGRVTRILEELAYRPGSTFAELTRAVGAPKSSMHGFVRGLVADEWLVEDDHRLYLGATFYHLAVGSGRIRAGTVSDADLAALHRETGLTAFVGVRAGDHLIYVAEAGSDMLSGFGARSNIRRSMLTAAGGRALLAELPQPELDAFLHRRGPEEQLDVEEFIGSRAAIRASRLAVQNSRRRMRTAVATTIPGSSEAAVAAVTLVGPTAEVAHRIDALGELLLHRVAGWGLRFNPARELV
jgi:DNA-binding IclR family transcriptional regulator